jgi:hypothetical protein
MHATSFGLHQLMLEEVPLSVLLQVQYPHFQSKTSLKLHSNILTNSSAGGFRSAAIARGGGLFIWGGEGGAGGVDRRLKKPVAHVALRDRIIHTLGQIIDGHQDTGTFREGHAAASEVPRSGVWWGKPRCCACDSIHSHGQKCEMSPVQPLWRPSRYVHNRLVSGIKDQVISASLGSAFTAAICNQVC